MRIVIRNDLRSITYVPQREMICDRAHFGTAFSMATISRDPGLAEAGPVELKGTPAVLNYPLFFVPEGV